MGDLGHDFPPAKSRHVSHGSFGVMNLPLNPYRGFRFPREVIRAVADSLVEAGERLFSFTRLPPSQWKSALTTSAIERLQKEFKRWIKTQTLLPSAETAAMLFWLYSLRGRSSCARSTAGKRWPRSWPSAA
jgi:transposase-like protein